SNSNLSEEKLYEFADGGIWFYTPRDCINSIQRWAASTPEGEASVGFAGLSGLQVAFINQYYDYAREFSINYGIPWEAVMAQGILESTSGTTEFATQRNNFFGIGAVDSSPNDANRFATPEEGWRGYYEFIRVNSRYREHGVFSGETVTDPYAYVQAVWEAGYATDPRYVEKLSPIIAAIIQYAESRADMQTSTELVQRYPQWLSNAELNSRGAGSIGTMNFIAVCADGALVSGGMTLEQAERFMEPYIELATQYRDIGTIDGVYYDVRCAYGPLANCSAFSRWFIAKYTTFGDPGQYDGKAFVSGLGGLGFRTGTEPEVYAVFSKSTGGDGHGHTGVVLGINEAAGKIIIGEASCNYDVDHIHAVEKDLSVFRGSEYTYAYTDNMLVTGI
ncbi:MAG: glucosaminidase domain-containing protein, partial [Candidatus Saccharibacteria bacterium]|nr:glucosaminidase domain-containing protein [Candidatus Saccharibacteria bacterium]